MVEGNEVQEEGKVQQNHKDKPRLFILLTEHHRHHLPLLLFHGLSSDQDGGEESTKDAMYSEKNLLYKSMINC